MFAFMINTKTNPQATRKTPLNCSSAAEPLKNKVRKTFHFFYFGGG